MSCIQQILRSKCIKILTGLFFVVSLYFVAWDKADAGSNDTKIIKPNYPKFNDNTGSSSFNRARNKISTSSFDNPIIPILKPDYIKYKQPKFPDFNKSILKTDYIKYKQPKFPDLNKDLKIAQPDDTLRYFNKKFITFPPPNKNTPYIDYTKQNVTKLKKIDSGFGKKRWWEIFKPNPF